MNTPPGTPRSHIRPKATSIVPEDLRSHQRSGLGLVKSQHKLQSLSEWEPDPRLLKILNRLRREGDGQNVQSILHLKLHSEDMVRAIPIGDLGRALSAFSKRRGVAADEVMAEAQKLLAALQQVSTEVKIAIQAGVPAPQLQQPTQASIYGGAALGGAVGYLTSFMMAKATTTLLASLAMGTWSPLAFPLVASVLNAAISEPIAGAIRTNWSNVPSPDLAGLTNYATAQAQWLRATISGDTEAASAWKQRTDEVVAGLISRAGNEAIPELLRSPEWPKLTAWLRTLLSDELPFFSFSVAYSVIGGLLPDIRAPWDSNAQVLGMDFFSYAIAGTLSGALTAVGQNWARQKVQGAQPKTGLHHDASGSLAKAEAKRAELTARLDATTAVAAVVAAALDQEVDGEVASDGDVKAVRIDALLRAHKKDEFAKVAANSRIRIKESTEKVNEKLKNLSHTPGRDFLSAWGNMATTFGEVPLGNTSWLKDDVQLSRLFSKVLGYAVSLGPAAGYLVKLGEVVKSATDAKWPAEGAQKVREWASPFGLPLIAGWSLRHVLTGIGEVAVAALVGSVERVYRASYGLNSADQDGDPHDSVQEPIRLEEVVVHRDGLIDPGQGEQAQTKQREGTKSSNENIGSASGGDGDSSSESSPVQVLVPESPNPDNPEGNPVPQDPDNGTSGSDESGGDESSNQVGSTVEKNRSVDEPEKPDDDDAQYSDTSSDHPGFEDDEESDLKPMSRNETIDEVARRLGIN